MKIKALVFLGALFAAIAFSTHETRAELPSGVASDLNRLIAVSIDNEVDPRIFELIERQQQHAKDIALIVVTYFGYSPELHTQILQAISDADIKSEVDNAISQKRADDEAGGFGRATSNFNAGLTPNAFGTAENPSRDLNSPMVP